jgi:probable HAF family extracellular repeat protein
MSSIQPPRSNPPGAPSSAPAAGPAGSPSIAAGPPANGAGLPRHYTSVRLPIAAHGINDRGQVVGTIAITDRQSHAALWNRGEVVDLGGLGAAPEAMSMANDINAHGDVVGVSDGPNGQRAVLWRAGQIVDLGSLGGASEAMAINDHGQIVGTSWTAAGELHGFLWEDGQMHDLGIPGQTFPADINNKGLVVGASEFGLNSDGGWMRHAFLWQNGVVHRLDAPGKASRAAAINERGEIVDSYTIDIERGVRAVRWHQGTMTELGSLANGPTAGR